MSRDLSWPAASKPRYVGDDAVHEPNAAVHGIGRGAMPYALTPRSQSTRWRSSPPDVINTCVGSASGSARVAASIAESGHAEPELSRSSRNRAMSVAVSRARASRSVEREVAGREAGHELRTRFEAAVQARARVHDRGGVRHDAVGPADASAAERRELDRFAQDERSRTEVGGDVGAHRDDRAVEPERSPQPVVDPHRQVRQPRADLGEGARFDQRGGHRA